MDKLTFVGMVLSANGISFAADKAESVTSAREPQNVSEIRNFLGLVNYCGRLIPDLRTPETSDKGKSAIRVWKRAERSVRGIEEAPI